jgi:hypothetical protein
MVSTAVVIWRGFSYRRQMPLSDNEVYDRLHAALGALGSDNGQTTRGDSALTVARRSLVALQLALVMAQEAESDRLGCVVSPSEPAPRSG